MTTFVALDLETTGVDPEVDRIVEVGAVRFDESGQRIDEFSALVNPGRRLTAFIERLTGISNSDLSGADRFEELRPRLEAYLGEAVVIGHNVTFDLEFLAKAGVRWSGVAIDTVSVARVLMPGLPGYRLDEVAASLGLASESHHRALPDALLAGQVFFELLRIIRQLPERERRAVASALAGESPAWRELLGAEERPATAAAAVPVPRPFAAPTPLEPAKAPVPVTPADVARVFAALPEAVAGFEARPEQVEMSEAVRRAFDRGGHLMVEAETGVGKSLAYLIPAALDAVRNGRAVVVSTYTIALQEQLVQKDIPILREALTRAGVIESPDQLRVILQKGRANYLCYTRWLSGFLGGARDPEVAALAASTVRWVSQTETGDRSELRLAPDQLAAWRRLSADDATCLSGQNRHVRAGNCFLLRVRQSAEAAHIIVVNHALLLADAVSGGSALPAFEHLIVDEAHNLEDVATTQFGASLTPRVVSDVLDRLHRPGARDARESGIAALLKGLGTDEAAKSAARLQEAVAATRRAAVPFFLAAGALPGQPGDDNRMAITAAVRHRESWEQLEVAWEAFKEHLSATVRVGSQCMGALKGALEADSAAPHAAELDGALAELGRLGLVGQQFVEETDEETIRWAERDRDGAGSLHLAPLEVGPRLWDVLFGKRRVVVATSATLKAGRDLSFAARRIGLEAPEMLELGSPFDYRRAALLALVEGLPEPNEPGFAEGLAEAIAELAQASQGRAIALFTSNALLSRVAELVRPRMERLGIVTLAQGIDGTPRWMVEQLRSQPATLLLGSVSFWEGVDIRGDALSLVMITRLPFDVPSDPVARARAEQYPNPFIDYQLPSAVLRFRQGFGRLIRHKDDRGVVAVLDRRLWEKRYGKAFIDAIPPCTRVAGAPRAIARAVEEWLGGS